MNLQGQTVWNASGYRAFDVLKLPHDAVLVRSTRRRQSLPRATLEAAYVLGRRSDALESREIHQARMANFDPTFVVGILNAVRADRE